MLFVLSICLCVCLSYTYVHACDGVLHRIDHEIIRTQVAEMKKKHDDLEYILVDVCDVDELP